MIIDAHSHADWHGHNYDDFITNMDKHGIDKAWLLSWESPENEYSPESNAVLPYVLSGRRESFNGPIPFSLGLLYKQKAPERFILGYAPDPRRPEALESLKSAVSIYGVQVCGEVKLRMMYDNPDAVRMFRWCGEAGLPVTLHFDYDTATLTGRSYPRASWWYGGGYDTLERLLKLCPETNFLGHAPGFWCHISNDSLGLRESYPKGPVIPGGEIERLLDAFPNLYCDCSAGSGHNALSRDRGFTKAFILRYQDRMLYARDYFDNVHRELFDSLGLPAEVLEKLYYKNAQRLAGPEKTGPRPRM